MLVTIVTISLTGLKVLSEVPNPGQNACTWD
jgi:hypothetical protein